MVKMFGRIKSLRIRRHNSADSDSSSVNQKLKIAAPVHSESQEGYNAKLSDLASFDACVEACDALAASSSLAQSSITQDSETGMKDCSVVVSPDGDLLLLPQQVKEAAAAHQKQKNQQHLAPPPPGDGAAVLSSQSSEETIATPPERDEPTLADFASPSKSSSSTPMDFLTQHQSNDDYASAIIMGNDLKPGGDAAINGFSALGWSAAATSLAVRQTQQSLQHLSAFVSDVVRIGKAEAVNTTQACDHWRRAAGIGTFGHHAKSLPTTPLPAALKEQYGGGPGGGLRRRSLTGSSIDIHSLSDLESGGSSWNNHFGNDAINISDLSTHRVGPLHYPGSSLYAAMVALEQYHHLMAEQDSRRWRKAIMNGGVLPTLCRRVEQTAERAYHREKALKDMQRRVDEMEHYLGNLKNIAKEKWQAVYAAEERVTKILEHRMMERSRERERYRLEQLRREHEENEKSQVQLGATNSEIWDIVNSVTASMEEGDFTPIDFPTAPLSGPRDQSNSVASNTIANGITNVPITPPPPSTPMISRPEVEREVDLPGLRNAALAADDAVEDTAQSLLNILSSLDTTRRSARVAAETCLLASCNAQADTIKSLVAMEKQALIERLESVTELEQIVNKVNVREDLNMYVAADKKEKGGSTWMGDYDDGGVASALAVLSSHVDGSMGLGTPKRQEKSKMMTAWAEPSYKHGETTPEHLEDAVDALFANVVDDEQSKAEYEKIVTLLSDVAADKSPSSKSKRSTICYALNAKRPMAELKNNVQLDGVSRVCKAILSGCDRDSGGIANAKMCMMLAQTFYLQDHDESTSNENDNTEDSATSKSERNNRIYVKSQLIGHPLWSEDEFWDQALYQCVSESLTNSGVMENFERGERKSNSQSEWGPTYKLKWHDLSHAERSEAATQVHAVIFAQLGALAHSMMEFGCGIERSCNFVRRMSVRNQLPLSHRTMLLQHLLAREKIT